MARLSDNDVKVLREMREAIAQMEALLRNSRGLNLGSGLSIPTQQNKPRQINSQPKGYRDSPTTVGSAAEGSEAAEATTWDGYTTPPFTPVDVWVLSRIGYFHAGDEKLYAYYRKLSYDNQGRLYAVSAETRVEIDAPEACP